MSREVPEHEKLLNNVREMFVILNWNSSLCFEYSSVGIKDIDLPVSPSKSMKKSLLRTLRLGGEI